jgi:thiol-disulfide isomerase/thioredoxin
MRMTLIMYTKQLVLGSTLRLAQSLWLTGMVSAGCLLAQPIAFAQHSHGAPIAPSAASAVSSTGKSTGTSTGATAACKDTTLQCARAATPLFTQDGSLSLVWAGGGAISIARSTDLGASFEPRTEIAKHGVFLDTGPDARPQLVSDKQNNLIIAYGFFRDKNWNAQVNVSRSMDGGKNFSTPAPISADPTSQRFPSLLTDPQGQIFASWIDKRLVAQANKSGKKQLGGSIAYAWSTDGAKTFSQESIAQNSSCECCRIASALTPDGLPVILYRAIFEGSVRDHATQTFTAPTQPGPTRRVAVDAWATDSCPHHGPALAVSAAGVQHVAWFTQGSARTGSFYARSTDQGKTYSNPLTIGNPEAMPGRPYLLSTSSALWLTWKEFDGKRTAVFAQYSTDDGVQWSSPKMIAETVGYSDHPLLIQREGIAYLSWLTAAQGYRLLALEIDSPKLALYQPGDWKKILTAGRGKPQIIHFWGFTCGPCLEELPHWGKFLKEFASVKTVFIEVDQVPLATAAQALAQAGLEHRDNRVSAAVFDEYLRHEIDPKWQGELPITMLVNAKGEVRRIRGAVNFEQIRAWLRAQ